MEKSSGQDLVRGMGGKDTNEGGEVTKGCGW